MKNVFICIVFHHSEEFRPQGLIAAENFCKTWKDSKLPYNLLVLDNGSTCDFQCLNDIKHTFIRIEDQMMNYGITGAWNLLSRKAIELGADVIAGFSDDVLVNSSLKELIDNTVDDNTVYGPLTDKLIPPFGGQKSYRPQPGYRKFSSRINGFFFSFTRKFWQDKQVNKNLFLLKKDFLNFIHYKELLTEEDFLRLTTFFNRVDIWREQESMFQIWSLLYNTKQCIIGDALLPHLSLRSWMNHYT